MDISQVEDWYCGVLVPRQCLITVRVVNIRIHA